MPLGARQFVGKMPAKLEEILLASLLTMDYTERAMVQVQVDSIRVAAACPERTLILKPEDGDGYLPIWISPSQAEILADQLNRRPDKDVEMDFFLAKSNAAGADIRGAVVHLEGSTFHATVLLSQHGRDYETECPIGIALALAVRANAPILAESELFDRAGVRLS